MQYVEIKKNGDRISRLGLGCMRFPRSGGRIDQGKTNELVDEAIKTGINYFDTAYIYPGSEDALGKALSALGKRDQVFIATKLPHYTCKKSEDFDKIFYTQLERLRTGWIDYYLMHMLSNVESWERIKSFGVERWIDKMRGEGKIRRLGFSFHGGRDDFLGLIDVYDWDFCMVQYNYFDEYNQAGITGVRTAHEKGIPVFAMEPLLGGTLADDLPDGAKHVLINVNKDRKPADWALRWVLNHAEVTMALSGMSNNLQVAENSAVAQSALPGLLSEAELDAYKGAVAEINRSMRIKCTRCGYCMPCPKGVDIPECFSSYNASYMFGLISGIAQYTQVTGQSTPVQSDATKCIACGVCEAKCPQGIMISKEMANVRLRMKTFAIKPLYKFLRKLWGIK